MVSRVLANFTHNFAIPHTLSEKHQQSHLFGTFVRAITAELMAKLRSPEREPTRRSARVQKAKAVEQSMKDDQVSHDESHPNTLALMPCKKKVTKPKKFRRPKQRKSCKFLQLPGEIRNHIYQAALVETDEIVITKKGPSQPALLRVCRQIRREARGIYYTANKFAVKIERFEGAPLVPFSEQHAIWSGGANLIIRMVGRPCWVNFLAWLKEYHSKLELRPEMDDVGEGEPGRSPTLGQGLAVDPGR